MIVNNIDVENEFPDDIIRKLILEKDQELISKIKITSAAIALRDGTVFTGYSHWYITEEIRDRDLGNEYDLCHDDGFIIEYDNESYFVDRNHATKIAKAIGLIDKGVPRLLSDHIHRK